MPDARKEPERTDGLEHDDANVGAAHAGARENETNREQKSGNVDQVHPYLGMSRGIGTAIGVGAVMPFSMNHSVSAGAVR